MKAMTVATLTITTSASTNALMSPVAETVSSFIPAFTHSDTSLAGETSDSSISCCDMSNIHTTFPATCIQPIVTVCQSSNGTKRPQMKYDPEVPLSKEETSAWRREQRRKRNRESAAACRKRQRDRISELEVEVSGWKAMFDEAIRKLGEIEGKKGAEIVSQAIEMKFPERRCTTPSSSDTEDGENEDHVVSPCVSFHLHDSYNMVTPTDSRSKFIPTITTSAVNLDLPVLQENTTNKTERPAFIKTDSFNPRVEKGQHLSEMITRPAVKITGAVPTPLALIESACDELLELVPDSILSASEMSSMPFPQACPSLVQSNEDENHLIRGGEETNELDEFLLDAVQWL